MRTLAPVLAMAAAASAFDLSLRMNPVENSPCNDTVKQIAGYIDVSDTYNSHYFAWFSESRNAPSTDPLIVWFSGGPGCSSSLAMLTENGPCLARNDGSGTDFNPYGWNNKANLMFVDQPAGVGFSYSDSGGYSHNETQVALYMTVFFARFYEAYPEYAKNDLFIAAESYGGHYGPSIAYGLFEANKKGASFPLKGFAIGNGLVDPLHQYPTYPDFVEKECPAETGKECVPKAGIESMRAAVPQCTKLIQECQDDISDCGEAQSFCNNAMFGPYEQTGLNPYDIRIPCAVPPLCYDFSGVSTLLNDAATQKAIGVSNINWQSCNFEVNSQFSNDWMRNMAWKVPEMLASGIRAWIYAGTDDFIVQFLGDEAWTFALQWPGQAKYNSTVPQNWTTAGAVAGTHRAYGGLSFTTIYNAGHMAPRDQPEASLVMINAFISGSPLPGTEQA